MKVIYNEHQMRVPIKSWCADIDNGTWEQALNLSNHSIVWKQVALMPDSHSGYGMPIGGVIACNDAVIPNAVGVDGGCGMCSVRTDFLVEDIMPGDLHKLRLNIEKHIPTGEGNVNRGPQEWEGFDEYIEACGFPIAWADHKKWNWFKRSLGSLGGGNHFIELQAGDDGFLWVTLHSGSRNVGYSVCNYHHSVALEHNKKWLIEIPCDDLAYLPVDSDIGRAYINDMQFALAFARENRAIMMQKVKDTLRGVYNGINFTEEINIHHNYANLETHFGESVWIHRKGATLADVGVKGIIPGSMGSSTYIVEGLGNPESFKSCSHGAGRKMGRMEACRTLDQEECEKSMEGIEYDGFGMVKRKKKEMVDLGEAKEAYKDIDEVMEAQKDLVNILVKLSPIAVVKG